MKSIKKMMFLSIVLESFEISSAAEFENLYQAIAKALKTKKASKTTIEYDGKKMAVFYSKTKSGKPKRFAVIQKRIYEPNCTHTWVIGLNARSLKVEQIRVVEMSCPHAFPARKASYLEQYKGRGPASLKKLDGDISTIAKATGSCELTTDAVKVSIKAAKKAKKSL